MVDTVALFIVRGTHHRSQAHYQYKNIVQQFSCHSKHSYLSVNGPVTSAAIQIKKKKKHNLLHKKKKKHKKGS